jgi:hypothetical protein
VQKHAQKPPSKICSVSHALEIKMRIIVIGFILTFSNIICADGNNFLVECKGAVDALDGRGNPNNAIGTGRCLGYMQGMTNLNIFYSVSLKDKNQLHFCIPERVNSGQLARVVVKYLESNPQSLHENEGALTWSALVEAFPCK